MPRIILCGLPNSDADQIRQPLSGGPPHLPSGGGGVQPALGRSGGGGIGGLSGTSMQQRDFCRVSVPLCLYSTTFKGREMSG